MLLSSSKHFARKITNEHSERHDEQQLKVASIKENYLSHTDKNSRTHSLKQKSLNRLTKLQNCKNSPGKQLTWKTLKDQQRKSCYCDKIRHRDLKLWQKARDKENGGRTEPSEPSERTHKKHDSQTPEV